MYFRRLKIWITAQTDSLWCALLFGKGSCCGVRFCWENLMCFVLSTLVLVISKAYHNGSSLDDRTSQALFMDVLEKQNGIGWQHVWLLLHSCAH